MADGTTHRIQDTRETRETRETADTTTHRTSATPPEFGTEHPGGEWNSPSLVAVIGVRHKVAVDGLPEQRIAAIARLQRGCISRHQLLEVGLSVAGVSRLTARGALYRIRRGVFAVGHLAPTALRDDTSALLAARRSVALSHASAAALWDVAPERGDGELVHVVVDGEAASRVWGVCAHRSRRLQPRDVRIRQGLPVTSPARTLLDQAEAESDRTVELAFNELLVRRHLRVADVTELVKRSNGRRGVGILRALVAQQSAPTVSRSRAEELLLALLRSARLPPPLTNAPLLGFEADFFWPAHRLVVEFDSFQFHFTRRALERDRRKDAILIAAGYIPMRITWRELQDEPYAVVARIAETLGRTAP